MRVFACSSVKLFAPSTGAVGFLVSGVATAGVFPSVLVAGAVVAGAVVWAAAVRAVALNSAAARMIFFMVISSHADRSSQLRGSITVRQTIRSILVKLNGL
jgi:hypothetical protein